MVISFLVIALTLAEIFKESIVILEHDSFTYLFKTNLSYQFF